MAQRLKHLPTMQGTWVRSLGQEDTLEKEMARKFSTPVFLPGEFHGWRSLVGYSPPGRKESDTTERLHTHNVKSLLSGKKEYIVILIHFKSTIVEIRTGMKQ